MTLHVLTEGRGPNRRLRTNGLHQLGWAHFWLLIGILAGVLALAILTVFSSLLSV
jgi:hypothetical protein